jgi:hypothetical protein
VYSASLTLDLISYTLRPNKSGSVALSLVSLPVSPRPFKAQVTPLISISSNVPAYSLSYSTVG